MGEQTEREVARVAAVAAPNYAPLPVVVATAEGCRVTDIEGREYLDLLAAYGAVNQGHRHPRILAAMLEQLERVTITSRAFHNDRMAAFLERLCAVTGAERALPMNTGAEAVETAIKAMRRWGYAAKGIPEGQAEIIVCDNNFHGRTTTIVGFSSDPAAREGFGPFTPGFVSVPYGDAAALDAAITPRTCGFLVEPVQGEAGVILPPEGYLTHARETCTQNNVLLGLDEIQTGLGRTGAMFAADHEGVRADLVMLGKALGGGFYPVSAVVGRDDVLSLFAPGTHGSTFGGNPLAAAVGIASIDVTVDEDLPGRAADLGPRFREALHPLVGLPHVREVRGIGLMSAIEFVDRRARGLAEALLERGLLLKETHGTTLRVTPPLVIGEQELLDAAATIVEVCADGGAPR